LSSAVFKNEMLLIPIHTWREPWQGFQADALTIAYKSRNTLQRSFGLFLAPFKNLPQVIKKRKGG
jgi:hypothetical protein